MQSGVFLDEADDILKGAEVTPKRAQPKRPDDLAFQEQNRWSDADDQELTRLWDTGLSTRVIGQVLSRSKNSVVGRSHRLGLPSRLSPIIQSKLSDEERKAREMERLDRWTAKRAVLRSTLPALPSVSSGLTVSVTPVAVPRSPVAAPRPSRAVRAPVVTLATVKAEPPPAPIAKYGRIIECQTVTNPGRYGIGLTFCSKPSLPGGSWCEDCAAKYYVKTSGRVSLPVPENVGGIKSSDIRW